ncbi:MAG: sulfatase-like hydrolase/transferase [Deltaproteobacteria bacterium]|nr:sulfatase-like hydrolase/transferase [Deltaproteobacteria bacterium]MBW2387998.1 sulfatase-like hydrolase/transferase [Deltaproteobacteria bacterium]
MGRKILFITTDQQRYDALGCNGGRVARTPVVDRLAAEGINYRRAHNQSVVCMPARSTMVTGQYVRSHGVWMNGVPLPDDAPSIARYLAEQAGYRTALLGKAHFQPAFDPKGQWTEGQLAREDRVGPYRGFERAELVMHGPVGFGHYPKFMREQHPDEIRGFYRQVKFDADGNLLPNAEGGGDTGACQVHHNPVPREIYHTDWVADRTIAFLNELDADEDWFVWMSFPDPHHPWDPPQSELARCDWRDLALPDGYPGSPEKCREVLARKPHHWLDWYEGRARYLNIEAPADFVPGQMSEDQIREVNAMTHIENELIDEACGRVLEEIEARGWGRETDVFFTSDHGELQGDFGLLFKGPYHVDALMRVPLVWRPAEVAGVAAAEIEEPVGHIDLVATFCEIAGVPVPEWNEGAALPKAPGSDRERVLTEWDCDYRGTTTFIRSIYREGWLCSAYEKSTLYEGTEGELYDLRNDPHQFENRWDDPAAAGMKRDLVADLYDHLPDAPGSKRDWEAPV